MKSTNSKENKRAVHFSATMPADFRKALAASPKAQALWMDITPFARRDWILWINTAKRQTTRERRIEKACDMLASGKRRVCCFGGINWLIKNSTPPTKAK